MHLQYRIVLHALKTVLSGSYAKFTQHPAMKLHLLSTGNKRLAEANLLDPVWGIGPRADNPAPRINISGEGKIAR